MLGFAGSPQPTGYEYDELNRIEKKWFEDQPANTAVRYAYDSAKNGIGRLALVRNDVAVTIYEKYDTMGRMLNETRVIDAEVMPTSYSYDLAGRLSQVVYPDAYPVDYIYYPQTSLLARVSGPDTVFAEYSGYTPGGQVKTVVSSNGGTTTTNSYDPRSGRMTGIKTVQSGTAGVLQEREYGYYDSGDVEFIEDKKHGIKYAYSYDGRHRLEEEKQILTSNATVLDSQNWTYDDNGNILSMPLGGGETLDYTEYDPDHIHAVKNIRYQGIDYPFDYDENGNMLSGPDFTNPAGIATRSIAYNGDNFPVSVIRNGPEKVAVSTFGYDGDGVRVWKSVGNDTAVHDTTLYVGDYFEQNSSGRTKYIFGGNTRLAKIDDSGTFFFHKDHLGSTTVMTDSSGNLVASASSEYKPFGTFREGNVPDLESSGSSNYLFTDQEFDPESGLYFYDARYYDPSIGRFVSADTVIPDYGNPQSLNRYSYVLNNPLKYVDPTGHYWEITLDGFQENIGPSEETYAKRDHAFLEPLSNASDFVSFDGLFNSGLTVDYPTVFSDYMFYLKTLGVERNNWYEPFVFRKVHDRFNYLPPAVRTWISNSQLNQDISLWGQYVASFFSAQKDGVRLPKGYHLGYFVGKDGPGIYAHYDFYNSLSGPGQNYLHAIEEYGILLKSRNNMAY